MSKQDGASVRSAADLERKYNFDKKFADIMVVTTDARDAAEKAQESFDGLSQEQIFNILTNNGEEQGIYRQDGRVYINADFVKSGKISADYIDVANLKVDAAQITSGTIESARIGNLSADKITSGTIDSARLQIASGATIAGWNVSGNSISIGNWDYANKKAGDAFIAYGMTGSYTIAGHTTAAGAENSSKNWVFGAGSNFGVTAEGVLYATGANITGKITANSGFIGGWTLTKGETSNGTKYSSLTSGSIGGSNSVHLYTAYIGSSVTIGGYPGSDWRLTIGSKFGVDKDGALYCSGGQIGGWTISGSNLSGKSEVGTVTISPFGIEGPFQYPDGTNGSGQVSWRRILSAAMALETYE